MSSTDPVSGEREGQGPPWSGPVIVGCDFSEISMRAVAAAADWARRSGERLVLVFAISDDLPPALPKRTREATMDDHRAKARERLQEIAERLLDQVDFEILVVEGSAQRRLVEVAREHDAQLLVVGSTGHGLATQILLGTTAESVARRSPCSVLLVR